MDFFNQTTILYTYVCMYVCSIIYTLHLTNCIFPEGHKSTEYPFSLKIPNTMVTPLLHFYHVQN